MRSCFFNFRDIKESPRNSEIHTTLIDQDILPYQHQHKQPKGSMNPKNSPQFEMDFIYKEHEALTAIWKCIGSCINGQTTKWRCLGSCINGQLCRGLAYQFYWMYPFAPQSPNTRWTDYKMSHLLFMFKALSSSIAAVCLLYRNEEQKSHVMMYGKSYSMLAAVKKKWIDEVKVVQTLEESKHWKIFRGGDKSNVAFVSLIHYGLGEKISGWIC